MITIEINSKEYYIYDFLYRNTTFDIIKYKYEDTYEVEKIVYKFIEHNLFNILNSGSSKIEVFNIDNWITEIKKDNLDVYVSLLIEELYITPEKIKDIQYINLIEAAFYDGYYSMFNKIKKDFILYLEEIKN